MSLHAQTPLNKGAFAIFLTGLSSEFGITPEYPTHHTLLGLGLGLGLELGLGLGLGLGIRVRD